VARLQPDRAVQRPVGRLLEEPITIQPAGDSEQSMISILERSLIAHEASRSPAKEHRAALFAKFEEERDSHIAFQIEEVRVPGPPARRGRLRPRQLPSPSQEQAMFSCYTEDGEPLYELRSKKELNMFLELEVVAAFARAAGRHPSSRQLEKAMLELEGELQDGDELDVDGVVGRLLKE
jgi:hypothetical protein